MIGSQLEWLEKQKIKHKQEDSKLTQTKKCVEMLREARRKGVKLEIVNELFKLIGTMAKTEWGPDAAVDDFKIEGKFVISDGQREEII